MKTSTACAIRKQLRRLRAASLRSTIPTGSICLGLKHGDKRVLTATWTSASCCQTTRLQASIAPPGYTRTYGEYAPQSTLSGLHAAILSTVPVTQIVRFRLPWFARAGLSMTRNAEPLNEANKWLREAARDLHAAKLLLRPEESEPSRSLFHCQAVEKAPRLSSPFGTRRFARLTIWGCWDCSAQILSRTWLRCSQKPPT